jgi:uncharacterized membrane protein
MDAKAALISGLLIVGLLTIWYGVVSWIFSLLAQYGMPSQAFLIVAGLLTIVFAMLGARMFEKE